MWNNLRARHYSVLILLAIVTLETSAIAIDRFINREADVAFTIESPFQNNPFILSYQESQKPAKEDKIVIARTPATTAPEISAEVPAPKSAEVKNPTQEKVQSVSATFVAANNKPETAKAFVEYSIQPGDSLSNIAEMFGSNPEQIQHANQLSSIHSIQAGQTIKIPLPTEQMVYTVKKGDSLSRIASRFRVPMQELIKVNNLKSHMLMAEQKIRIPITDNRKNLSMVTSSNDTRVQQENLQIVKSNQLELVANPKGLQLVRNNKLQIAQAPASKPEVEVIEKELLKAPPVVNSATAKAETKAKAVTAAAAKPAENKPEPKNEVVQNKKPQVVAAKQETKNDDEEKAEKIEYTVVRGDSLLKIAHRHDTTAAQIQHDNELNGTLVKIGQKLSIQPGKKLYRVIRKDESRPQTRIANHKVQRGENLTVIARRYKTTINAIIAENNLSNTMVRAGQILKVPTNQASSARQAPSWRMPTRGRLSDRYGYRNHPIHKRRLFHAGIDVAAPRGTPIVAAMDGKVIFAGRRSGYGNLVIVSHANGYSTRYAHCNTINVRNGQQIKAGQLIARVGATGLATGNHLHFEIRKNGKPVNPLSYVKM